MIILVENDKYMQFFKKIYCVIFVMIKLNHKVIGGTNMTDNQQYQQPQQAMPVDQGSTGLGFVLGFFLGFIGLIIGLVMDKKNTKKGAIIGFVVQLGLAVVGGIIGLIVWLIIMLSALISGAGKFVILFFH